MVEQSDELINRLRSFPTETEYLEFKRSFSDFDKEGQDICALSNSAAYHNTQVAYKLWGIDDVTHEVVGTDFKPRSKKKGNQDLEMWLRQHLSPNVNFEFSELRYQGLPVVLLKVWPAIQYPARFNDSAYIRTNSSTQKLAAGSQREVELWKRIQQVAFEDQVALDKLTAEEVVELLDLDTYFNLLGSMRPTALDAVMHTVVMDSLIKEREDGLYSITTLGAILFAIDLSKFPTVHRKSLRIIRYEGSGRVSGRIEREFSRGYALDLSRAYTYLDDALGTFEVIQGVRRATKSVYPEVALRELIVNALIHQDFTITGTGPMVEIFDGRIEVTNPGSLLVDLERIVNDPPRSRNEKLSALMRRLRFCEEAGSGWDKIIEGCEAYHLPAPRIQSGTSVRVTLYQEKPYSKLTAQERLNACYWHACACFEEGEYLTNSSLRDRFNVPSSNSAQISRLIKEAVDRNLISPVDEHTSPRYMQYKPYWA